MTLFFIVLKISALLAVCIIPLGGPKKAKTLATVRLSRLAVKENGYLEYATGDTGGHHHME